LVFTVGLILGIVVAFEVEVFDWLTSLTVSGLGAPFMILGLIAGLIVLFDFSIGWLSARAVCFFGSLIEGVSFIITAGFVIVGEIWVTIFTFGLSFELVVLVIKNALMASAITSGINSSGHLLTNFLAKVMLVASGWNRDRPFVR
jgi:hypothetical protein